MKEEQIRRENIMQWLLKPEQKALRVDYQDGKGFHVSGRTMIQPKDKAPLPITEAMRQAGFEEGCEVGGYVLRIKPAETVGDRMYAETFKFFPVRPPVQVSDNIF